MTFPSDLPTRTDESIGRTKVNTGTYTNTSTQADAGEYNRLLDTVVGLAGANGGLGLPAGTTSASAWQAILGGRAGSQVITGTDTVDENAAIVRVQVSLPARVVTLGDIADGRGRSILLWNAGPSFDLSASGTGATFVDSESSTRATNEGLYLLSGRRVGAELAWIATRLDTTEWEAAIEAEAASRAAGDALLARGGLDEGVATYSGAGAMDLTTRAHRATGGTYTLTLADPGGPVDWWLVTEATSLTIDPTATIDGAASLTLPDGSTYPVLVRLEYDGSAWRSTVLLSREAIAASYLASTGHGGLGVVTSSSGGVLSVLSAGTNDRILARVSGSLLMTQVTLGMIAASVQSAAQGVESLRQIYTSTPAAIGTASAGSSVLAAAGDHSHAHGSQTDGSHHAAATTSVAGFMSAADKTSFDKMKIGLDSAGYRAITNSQTIDSDDIWIRVDTSGGAVAITLPAAAQGRRFHVKKKTTDANGITLVRAASESIEGVAATFTLPGATSATLPAWTFFCDGTNWWLE